MEFYIDSLRLPVPVQEVSVKSGTDINTISLAKGGELGIFAGKKLDTISFSSFYPATERSYCQYQGFPSVETFINTIETAQKEGNPVRFIITETDINKQFLVDSFEKTYKINGRGDLYFSLSLVEYKEIVIPQIAPANTDKAPTKTPTPKRPTDKKKNKSSKTHIVKSGDTLMGLAKRYYGNSNEYKKIYNANKNLIKNPNLIKDGWKLVIP